jgi:DNA-directed RNA polymerase specialized sigma24 family protein
MAMKDPAHVADEVVRKALSPVLREAIPPNLGREVYCKIRRRLRSEGLAGDDHAQEVFSLAMLDACEYLHRHSGNEIRHPRGWLHVVANHATLRYLREFKPKNTTDLEPLLRGEVQCEPDSSFASDEGVLKLVRETIEDLPPRYRQLIWLDLGERLSPGDIRRRMRISTDGYWRKLKSEAFSALREALEKRI